MAQSIDDQLQELAQFKTLISIILRETGNTAPDTGFRQWYEAIKYAITNTNGRKIIETFEVKPAQKVAMSENVGVKDLLQQRITESFTITKVVS